jgi:aminopeptidase N
VIVEGAGQPAIVSAAAPVTVPSQGQPAPVINAGQTGYFRSAYAPELWGKLAPRYPQLAPADQLGLLFDSRALGEAGVVPMSDFLDLAKTAPPTGDPVVLETLTDQLAGLDWLFGKRPTQAAYRAFVISRLTPIAQRIGWDPRSGESDNEAVLRRSLLGTLGALHDPATVAEARRRFDRYLADRQSLAGAGRRTVLSIVAANADAATWEALLKLALSGEISKTDAPSLIAAVSGDHPDEAFDFAVANRGKVDELLEPTSRTTYYSRLASASRDPAMLKKLEALAPSVPASSRGELEKAAAAIRVRLEIIAKRVPQMEAWLARNG